MGCCIFLRVFDVAWIFVIFFVALTEILLANFDFFLWLLWYKGEIVFVKEGVIEGAWLVFIGSLADFLVLKH